MPKREARKRKAKRESQPSGEYLVVGDSEDISTREDFFRDLKKAASRTGEKKLSQSGSSKRR